MNFQKLCIILVILLCGYVLISNYGMLDIVSVMKQKLSFTFPTNFVHKETGKENWRSSLASNNATRNNATISTFTTKKPTQSSNGRTWTVLPTYDTFDAMIQDDMHTSMGRSFSQNSLCPYEGLRKPFIVKSITNDPVKCHRRPLTSSDCQDMLKEFGQLGSIKAGKCKTSDAIKLCSISEQGNEKRAEFQISCNANLCKGKGIYLGLFKHTIGKVKWRPAGDIKRLNKVIRQHVLTSAFASGFVLLKCEGGEAIQVLSFPKILKSAEAEERPKNQNHFNINIVLEDSLSRAHFYRTLLKTASTFRDIIYNQSIPSTLLEFEKVQSYASNTYLSLQRLFAAQKYVNSESKCEKKSPDMFKQRNDTKYACTYGIEDFFTRFKKAGYSTFVQEDHCWYDEWGSFLDPRKRVGHVRDEKTRLSRWKTFVEIAEKSGRKALVDDYGMSILTCDAYAKYKVTNPFSSKAVPNICFAGRHYPSLFFEYVKRYMELNDKSAQPFVAYTHVLTSHDTNGRRIVNDDASLSDLFRHAAHLRNTVTIFASDHGAKATHFAAYTSQGRQEVFQPLLFIIIPHEVSKVLGKEVMNALVANQKRLVGLEDLHDALVSIVDPGKPSVSRGLFKPVPLDRTCEQMHLNSDVLCLCEGMDKAISNVSHTVIWAAEHAIGSLNNRIQEEFIAGVRKKHGGKITSGSYGYGACQRYTGVQVMQARHAITGDKETLFLSISVKTSDGKTIEIFDVQVSFFVTTKTHGLSLDNLIRVSPFNEYEQCADEAVEPKLCSCRNNDSLWRNELHSKLSTEKSFKMKPTTQFLDRPCLTIISRSRQINVAGKPQDAVLTYEALNACADVTYKLIITFRKASKTRISLTSTRPYSVTLLPRTATFLFTAMNEWRYGKIRPNFRFEKSKLSK